jgi:hypothetical protein
MAQVTASGIAVQDLLEEEERGRDRGQHTAAATQPESPR